MSLQFDFTPVLLCPEVSHVVISRSPSRTAERVWSTTSCLAPPIPCICPPPPSSESNTLVRAAVGLVSVKFWDFSPALARGGGGGGLYPPLDMGGTTHIHRRIYRRHMPAGAHNAHPQHPPPSKFAAHFPALPRPPQADQPIVMVSVGMSADFGYKMARSAPDRHVVLESGDAIVFGGPARDLCHAVLRIHPERMPEGLRLPMQLNDGRGRMSVTWRDVGPEDGYPCNSDERLGLTPTANTLPRYRPDGKGQGYGPAGRGPPPAPSRAYVRGSGERDRAKAEGGPSRGGRGGGRLQHSGGRRAQPWGKGMEGSGGYHGR